jgi:hypothetical protein
MSEQSTTMGEFLMTAQQEALDCEPSLPGLEEVTEEDLAKFLSETIEGLFLTTKRYLGDRRAALEHKKWVQPLHRWLRYGGIIKPKNANRRVGELKQIIGKHLQADIVLENIRSFHRFSRFLCDELNKRSDVWKIKKWTEGISRCLDEFGTHALLIER